jgi:hypothetical protein
MLLLNFHATINNQIKISILQLTLKIISQTYFLLLIDYDEMIVISFQL